MIHFHGFSKDYQTEQLHVTIIISKNASFFQKSNRPILVFSGAATAGERDSPRVHHPGADPVERGWRWRPPHHRLHRAVPLCGARQRHVGALEAYQPQPYQS